MGRAGDPETIYCFGDYRFVPNRQLLSRDGRPVPIGTRALDLLHLLVARSGEVVSKQALIDFAWPNIFVHPSNLKVNVATLRRALRQTDSALPYIATVPGRGYRFVAPVRVYGDSAERSLPEPIEVGSTHLPPLPALIGRADVLSRLSGRLFAAGLLTIVGSAGVGKTTIAVATARQVEHRYKDGVCFVDLAAIGDPQLVAMTIALSLGVGANSTNVLAGLIEALRDKHLLIVLDNCEHVLSVASAVAEQLRSALPDTHILATSREPLRSRAETVYRLPALQCPEEGRSVDAADTMAFPATELLVTRAKEAHGFQLDDVNAPAIAAICRRLDGIALAIELAAPRLAVCDPTSLLRLLEQSFEPLNLGSRTAPVRHQTLLATLDWSYRLLSSDEVRLLRLLSVFTSTFSLDDAIGIAGHIDATEEDVAAITESLVSKSLLSVAYEVGGLRYRLLDSTRSFAAERLRAEEELPQALASYAHYLLRVFELAEAEWHWRAREEWTARYGHRTNDLRKAIEWAFGESGEPQVGVRLTSAAIPLWDELSTVGESRLRVERALRSSEALASCDPALKMKLTASYASGLNFSEDLGPEADTAWNEAYRLASAVGNVDYRLRSLWGLAVLESFTGRHQQALATMDRFKQIAEQESERSAHPDGERVRLMAAFYRGDIVLAHEGLSLVAQEHASADNRSRIARFQVDRSVGIRVALAAVTWVRGDHRQAMAMVEDALARAADLGHLVSQANALAQTALPLNLWTGSVDVARQQVAILTRNLARREISIWRPICDFYQGAVLSADGDPDGVDRMHAAIEKLVANNFLVRVPMYLTMVAEVALREGRVEFARESVNAAFDRAERQGEYWSQPELLRLRGMLQWRDGDLSHAGQTFLRAAQLAAERGALSFQLRAATKLAELLDEMKQHAAAVMHLAPIYGRFDQSFRSTDVVRAGDLLSRLGKTSRPFMPVDPVPERP